MRTLVLLAASLTAACDGARVYNPIFDGGASDVAASQDVQTAPDQSAPMDVPVGTDGAAAVDTPAGTDVRVEIDTPVVTPDRPVASDMPVGTDTPRIDVVTAVDSGPRDVVAADLVLGDVPRDGAPSGIGAGLSPDAIPDRRVTCDAMTAARTPSVVAGSPDRIVLRGRVIAATGVIPQGEVLVVATGTGTSRVGRIACVAASCAGRPGYDGATVVQTAGVIAPGLVDTHNHPQYNWLPPWTPPRLFQNSDQWQSVPEYRAFTQPLRDNEGTYTCEMVKWGELRSLFAGTTTLQGAPNRVCVTRTLVRDIEYGADFEGIDRHRPNTLGIATVNAMDAMGLRADMDSGALTAYILHLGEGINEASRREFDLMLQRNLLAEAMVIIHGTALGRPEFDLVGRAGAKLVWSPRSNVILYGRTTDVGVALDAGVTVALAPDWSPSGGPNLLSEMRYARYVSRTAMNNRLTDRMIFDMATRNAALAVDRPQVGEIAEGRYADLMVIPDRGCDAYSTVIDAPTADLRLVLVNGRPLYGDAAVMNAMPATLRDRCEAVTACGQGKTACVAQADTTNLLSQTAAEIESRLRTFSTPYPLVPLCP
ncbi:MAG: amidohydrolase family protein [Polyangiales bacterium]